LRSKTSLVRSQISPEVFMTALTENLRRPQDEIRFTERQYLAVKQASK